MIRDLSALTLDNGLSILYGAIAASVTWGAVLGVAAVWLSVAARGGDR